MYLDVSLIGHLKLERSCQQGHDLGYNSSLVELTVKNNISNTIYDRVLLSLSRKQARKHCVL